MFSVTIDGRSLIKDLDDVAKRQLPFATMQALNETMFDVYSEWGEEMDKVFDNPTDFTRRSVRYQKATKERLEAHVFLRDEATKGNPPARYLEPEAKGGKRRPKPYENDLRMAGVLSDNEYTVPAKGFPLDFHGNVPRKVITRILSDLQASRDEKRHSTRESRHRRSRRRFVSDRAVYFYWPGDKGQGRTNHSLPRGIYERFDTAFGSGVRLALAIVRDTPDYRVRFNYREIAERIFYERFPPNFEAHLRRALASAK